MQSEEGWKDTPFLTFLPFFLFFFLTDAHNHISCQLSFYFGWHDFLEAAGEFEPFLWKTNKWRFIEMFFLRLLLSFSFCLSHLCSRDFIWIKAAVGFIISFHAILIFHALMKSGWQHPWYFDKSAAIYDNRMNIHIHA